MIGSGFFFIPMRANRFARVEAAAAAFERRKMTKDKQRRTTDEIKPQPAMMRTLAEQIAKVIVSNPVLISSWQYERIVAEIEKYTQAIKAELN